MELELHLKSTLRTVNDLINYIDKIISGVVEEDEMKSTYNNNSTQSI